MSDATYHYRAELIRVIDGDTIVARIDLGFHTARYETLRLLGIDAPELRGATKRQARAAAAYLKHLIAEQSAITIRTQRNRSGNDRTGKYGRYLATLFGDDGLNLNEQMVAAGHARRS